MDVAVVLLFTAVILFLGFLAEFLFRKFGLPDTLMLIIVGFLLGPYLLGYASGADVAGVAPLFVTFTLLFLLFDGAFSINIRSLVREFSFGVSLTIISYLSSMILITGAMVVFGFDILTSLFTGLLLGGVSSAFTVPILKQIKVSKSVYSILVLESALTDVLCIVFSFAVLGIIKAGEYSINQILSQLASLFAVAGLVGIIGGIIWTVVVVKVLREHNYMITIAALIVVYVVTEYLHGNGAISALFFGLVLKNSESLLPLIITQRKRNGKNAGKESLSATVPSEQYFYHQISFFLKTFFFVYIGILIDLSDWKAIMIGLVLSVLVWLSRYATLPFTQNLPDDGRALINAVFARGLAAAVIAQIAILSGIPGSEMIAGITYITITGTIILSSIRVFMFRRKYPSSQPA